MTGSRDDCSEMSTGEEFHDNVSFAGYDGLRNTYPGIEDFQSDGFHTDDFRTEEFQSEDFHSAFGCGMTDEFEQLGIDETRQRASPISLRLSRSLEGEPVNFFQGIDVDEHNNVAPGTDVRATSTSTVPFVGNFPPTLSALPDLAGNGLAGLRGNESVSSYDQSGGAAPPVLGMNNNDNELGIDDVPYYGQFVQPSLFTDQTLYEHDHRWTQPWNHLDASTMTMREETMSSDFTCATHVPPSTAYSTSVFTPSESGPSLSSYFSRPVTSNNSGEGDAYMTDSQATMRPIECDSRPMLGNGTGISNAPRRGLYDHPGVPGQAPCYLPGSRPVQSGATNCGIRLSRGNSTASGSTGARTRAEQSQGLPCPIEDCHARFRGKHQRGSLHRHMRMKHSNRGEEGTMTYPCEVSGCTKIFMRMDSRLKHYRKRHEYLNVPPAVPRR